MNTLEELIGGRPNARNLKVERTGDFALGKIKPAIRLKGSWLERAGFLPDTSCQIIVVGNGKLELHALPAAISQ